MSAFIAMGENLAYYAILLTSTLLSIFLLQTLYSKLRNRHLKLPPSPPALPIIGHLHHLAPIPHQSFQKLSFRYGPLVHLRLGSVPCVVVSSPDTAIEILKTQELNFLNRPVYAAVYYLTYGSSDFIFSPYGPYWRFMRRICVEQLLNKRTLDQFHSIRREESMELIQCLYEKANEGKAADVGAELMKMTNNEISRVAVGRRCSGSDGEAEEAKKIVEETMELLGKFNMADYIGLCKYFDLQGIDRKLKDVHKRYDNLMERIMKEKEEARNIMSKKSTNADQVEKVKDLLDLMMDIADDENEEMKLTRKQIKGFILDVFLGGTDTTALTTSWGLAELINHPKALRTAQAEIDSVVGKDRIVGESDIPNLPYLQAIVKETLRLHPNGPLIHRKTSQDCKIKGYDIPANAHIFVNAWAINRHPDHWDDPLEFRPERFIGAVDIDVKGQHFQLLPFGSGRRGCPGSILALQVIHLALAAMVQCFDWEVEGGVVDMSEGVGLSLPMAKPMLCRPLVRLNPMPPMA